MSESGFLPLWRKVFEPGHWLAPTPEEPASRLHAWMDMCQMATHQKRTVRVKGSQDLALERGQLVASLRTLGRRWCWSKNRVARFLDELVQRGACERIERKGATTHGTRIGTVYAIVKYDTYADVRDRKRDTPGTPPGQEQPLEPLEPLGRTHAKPRTQVPDSWVPNDGHRQKASSQSLDVEREAEAFRDHHRAKGTLFADVDRGFYTWLRRAVEFRGAKNNGTTPGALKRPNLLSWQAPT